ncbi:Gfo/Idh/MocA family oxidoreductase [Dysgonomonas sp. BGC7]|uniref:Gfo/Idh/MocA family oxidoreductase n=1 Tax=Dysgonomonas sp. BGC7 TaxID=1658008 RepID=UPI0006830958|nr:Gfo/Idh/MocA family oxidoreductase [Dysgonomonas sp. BGC7]MBD8387283.1 Gfo/Idh/MocA family oxidoreductase [Dysgonomonas sp. BGC7]
MAISRRNFLKAAGFTGAALVTGCTPTGKTSGTDPKAQSEALGNILSEAQKTHAQIFNMSGYCAPKIENVRIGFIGTGNRGSAAVERMSYIEGVNIKAICDVRPEKAQAAKERIKTTGHEAILYTDGDEDWMNVCKRDDIDLIYLCTHWELHAPIAIYAMEQGKHVALEVPAATTVEDCWKLVETSEKTKKHCVILENCCYDFFELLTLNMARQGFFGELIHCEGAYIHDILESFVNKEKRYDYWRLKENAVRNGNLYPTHGLGPVCQIMNINRGDKMEYLTSMASNDFNTNNLVKEAAKKDPYFNQYIDKPFRGNMNTTTIRTKLGRTILLQHDVTSPRPYSRLHTVSGTKAFAQKYPLPGKISIGHGGFLPEDEYEKLNKQYTPAIINKIGDLAQKVGGHGGMDFMMDWRLIDCLRNGLPVDMDVYDAALWSVMGPLSEWSIANRSNSIEIPDFTNGSWATNKPVDISLAVGGTTGVQESAIKGNTNQINI